MAGVDNRLLIQEARELPDPERSLLTHNERELINLAKQLADALEASDAAYLELFETGTHKPRPFNAD